MDSGPASEQGAEGRDQAQGDRPGDGVIDVINEVESSLAMLRAAHEERRKAMEALARERSEIEERERALTEQMEAHERQRQEIESQRQEVDQARGEIESSRRELDERGHTLQAEREQFDHERGEFNSERERLASERSEFDGHCQEAESKIQEAQRIESELDAKRLEIERQAAQLQQESDRLKDRDRALMETREGLIERDEAIKRREGELQQEIHRLEQRASAMEHQGRQLHEATEQLTRARSDLEEARRVSRERREEVDHLTGQLRTVSQELEDAKSQIRSVEKDEGTLASREDALERQQAAFEQVRQTTEQQKSEIEGQRAALEELESTLQEREQAISELETKAAAQESALRERTEQLEASGSDIDTARAEAARAREDLDASSTRVSELEGELQQLRAELAERTGQLEEAQRAIEEASSRCEQIESTAETLRASSDEHRASMEQELEQLRAELQEAASAEAEELRSTIRERDERIAALETACEGDPEVVQKLRDQIAEEELNRSILEDKLAETAESLQQQRVASDGFEGELESMRSRLAEVEGAGDHAEALSTANARLSELEREVEIARNTSSDAGWVQRRRERLDKMRDLLRGQSDKIQRAGEALRERHAQYEQVLSRRAELAKAAVALREAEERSTRDKARSSVIWLLTGVLSGLAILAGMAWVTAMQVAPGQYAAVAVIEADGGALEPSATELEEWQVYHENLLTDPRFLEKVADRMRRRGIAALGSPGLVREHIRGAMDFQSPRPGRLEIEWKGEGATRTERELDTYIVALASTSNGTRTVSGLPATTITQPAGASAEPLDKTHLAYAGTLFGGGGTVVFLTGYLIWRRMVNSKEKFERDHELSLLDESSWDDAFRGAA